MHIIVIRGPSGVGKTSVALRLSDYIHAEYFSFDEVMKLHELDADVEGIIPIANFIKANEIIFSEIKTTAADVCILDCSLYHKEHLEDIQKRADESCITMSVFTMDASLVVCQKRNSTSRTAKPNEKIEKIHSAVHALITGIVVPTRDKTVRDIVGEIARLYLKFKKKNEYTA